MRYLEMVDRRLSSEPLIRIVGLIGLVFAVAIAAPSLLLRNRAPGFLPHLFCYFSNPALTWTHVTSDVGIGLSYLAISLTLLYIVHRSRSAAAPFSWLLLAFGLFIVACGGTHVMEVITVWHPMYWVSASIKVLTAGASLATAIALPLATPQILDRLQAAGASEERRVQLQAANTQLARLNQELKEFDNLKDGIMAQQALRIGDWEWNIKSGVTRWFSAVHMVHGFTPGTFDGRYEPWVTTVHPDDRCAADYGCNNRGRLGLARVRAAFFRCQFGWNRGSLSSGVTLPSRTAYNVSRGSAMNFHLDTFHCPSQARPNLFAGD